MTLKELNAILHKLDPLFVDMGENASTRWIDTIIEDALDTSYYWANSAEVVGEFLGDWASDQITRGGELIITTEEGEEFTLNLTKMLNGIELFIKKYGEKRLEDIDVMDSDSMIQFALFGEEVYG